MISQKRLKAYLRLHLADGVGAVTFRRLVEAFGDIEAAAGASSGQWQRVKGVGEKTAAALSGVTDAMIDDELACVQQHNARIITAEDDDYPPALTNIHDGPALLYVRGAIERGDALAMGIVGSRRCTQYGLEQAERFGQMLARAGFTIVSGGARGIDTGAHRGALAGGGRTIAVMGCGLSQMYPPENRKLFEQIVAEGRGALVSELPMKTAVLSGNFPTRNRVISGLSLGVLVVEAARRSGSLHTATEAAEQGRVVFAIPGRVDSPLSQGANELIRGGAILTQCLEDVLEHLGEVGSAVAPQEEAAPAEAVPRGLDETETSLLRCLGPEAMSLDELIRASGVDGGRAISSMMMLVLKGHVVQQPGNVYARRGR